MISKELLMMPKIDLHCHLDGSMTLQGIREILGKPVGISELQVNDDCGSLKEYLEKFDLPLSCLQTEEGIRKSAGDFLRSLSADHVQYAEVRFAPMLSCGEGLSCRNVMEAALEGLKEASKECGIFYQVIACAMRHHDAETNIRMMKECREFLGDGLCAVDLAGDEAGFPLKLFGEVFEAARRLDYPFTIHAGECGSAENIALAAEWGAKRVGHGIAMAGHDDVMELCRRQHIGIEMCPVSNYQTKAIRPGEIYPIREFSKNGLLVTVNTDNRTVSNTSITKEFELLHDKFGVTEEELRQYELNAVETAFADDAVKHNLWKNLN